MRSERILVGLALAVVVAAGVPAGLAISASPSSPRPPAPARPACALPVQSIDTLSEHNASNPDTAADYWIIVFKVRAGLRITVSGTFPDSRYFSLEVYDSRGLPFTADGVGSALADYRIAPEPGSVNPWQHQAPPGGRFSVTVRSGATAGQANTLPLAPAGTAAGTMGSLYFRVYLAHQSPSQTPLPAVTATLDGASGPVPACPPGSAAAGALATAGGGGAPQAASPGKNMPAPGGIIPFLRGAATAQSTPDSNDAYLKAYFIPPRAGEVVVVRGRAPVTPSGSSPSPWPAPGTDLQYWSLCDDLLLPDVGVVMNPLPGGQTDYGCRYDQQARLDRHGYYTFVVGTEAQRAAIERIPGATFLPLSAADPTGTHQLAFRNTLPAPGFSAAIENVPQNQSPASAAAVMGSYYPRIAFCSLATLARGGPAACFKDSA
jgi:hypothetical protein